jgi:DnaK suppressor protein
MEPGMSTATRTDPMALQAHQMLLRRREVLRALLGEPGLRQVVVRCIGAGPGVERAVGLEQRPVLGRRAQQEQRELEEVEQALERIAQGSFGTCEACGGAVGRHRLLAVPEARHCLGCSNSTQLPPSALP